MLADDDEASDVSLGAALAGEASPLPAADADGDFSASGAAGNWLVALSLGSARTLGDGVEGAGKEASCTETAGGGAVSGAPAVEETGARAACSGDAGAADVPHGTTWAGATSLLPGADAVGDASMSGAAKAWLAEARSESARARGAGARAGEGASCTQCAGGGVAGAAAVEGTGAVASGADDAGASDVSLGRTWAGSASQLLTDDAVCETATSKSAAAWLADACSASGRALGVDVAEVAAVAASVLAPGGLARVAVAAVAGTASTHAVVAEGASARASCARAAGTREAAAAVADEVAAVPGASSARGCNSEAAALPGVAVPEAAAALVAGAGGVRSLPTGLGVSGLKEVGCIGQNGGRLLGPHPEQGL